MLRWFSLLCLAVICHSPVHSQPVFCTEDAQCSNGYYCETDAHICRECLNCQDLMREPPLTPNACIKSVADCGSCNKGLVVDRLGDVNTKCVPPDSSQLEPVPYYVWLLIGFGVLVFLGLVVGIIAYLVRSPEIFKFGAESSSSRVTAHITATAPEYTPTCPAPHYPDTTTPYNEDNLPFIERSPMSHPQAAREYAPNQAARVYDRPSYDRGPRPPSPETPPPEYSDEMVFPVHDETTVPSDWTPNGTNGDVNANVVEEGGAPAGAGSSLPAMLAAARDTTLVEHSAAKKRCVRQDSNNRNRESNCGDSSQNNVPRSPSPSQSAPYSFVTQINVVQINSTK